MFADVGRGGGTDCATRDHSCRGAYYDTRSERSATGCTDRSADKRPAHHARADVRAAAVRVRGASAQERQGDEDAQKGMFHSCNPSVPQCSVQQRLNEPGGSLGERANWKSKQA